jgi:valyl-tRNA synthetase
MPFVSEEIYQALHANKDVTICTSTWPKLDERFNEKVEIMDLIQDIITNVRATKNEYNLAPSKPIDIIIRSLDINKLNLLEDNRKYLERFTFANTLEFINDNRLIDKCKTIILPNLEVLIPLKGMINIEEEIKNLTNEINKLTGEIKRCEGMLNNPNFLNKAPEAKINEEKAKLENYKAKMNIALERLESYKNQ